MNEITLESARAVSKMKEQRELFVEKMIDIHGHEKVMPAVQNIIHTCHEYIAFLVEEIDKRDAIDVEFHEIITPDITLEEANKSANYYEQKFVELLSEGAEKDEVQEAKDQWHKALLAASRLSDK